MEAMDFMLQCDTNFTFYNHKNIILSNSSQYEPVVFEKLDHFKLVIILYTQF